jgi:hypothetical protein
VRVKEDFATHGKMSVRPEWTHCRECAVHGQHGPLYACPEYSFAVLAEIANAEAKYVANLHDLVWCHKQIAGGVPPMILEMFRTMIGINE